ncbi:hypothetical protein K438DRAFT_1772350 [Mycena galopus ATCC 62051]|nr:hypothetical protein K438DRAFT_1772350 [Mycena galopus ATCC 62051]
MSRKVGMVSYSRSAVKFPANIGVSAVSNSQINTNVNRRRKYHLSPISKDIPVKGQKAPQASPEKREPELSQNYERLFRYGTGASELLDTWIQTRDHRRRLSGPDKEMRKVEVEQVHTENPDQFKVADVGETEVGIGYLSGFIRAADIPGIFVRGAVAKVKILGSKSRNDRAGASSLGPRTRAATMEGRASHSNRKDGGEQKPSRQGKKLSKDKLSKDKPPGSKVIRRYTKHEVHTNKHRS